jgi:hypothetical protein
MHFEFTIEEVNMIMGALARLPYEAVAPMIDNIRRQAEPQLQQMPPAEDTVAGGEGTE